MLQTLSLTQRLTAFFTAAAAVVVVGLGLLFIEATKQHFVDLDRATLLDKQHLIEAIVRSASSAEDTTGRLREALSHHDGLYVVATTAQNDVLYKSQGFLPPSLASSPNSSTDGTSPSSSSGALEHWRSQGQDFRALRFRVSPAYEQASALDILAAVDTGHHEHFLSKLRRTLVLYALLAVAACGLLGWLAAHQGLAPLRAMRDKAAAVAGHLFTERMTVQAVPVEMADLAAELNAMLDRLRDDYRRLAEFSSDLAHELRTPISNLLTQTQVALSSRRDVQTYQNTLASNAEELESMARMVADMLFLAKAERGMALPNRANFSAAREVAALFEFYDAVAEHKGVNLRVSGDAQINGDKLMFRRAISNLLSNAVRHADQNTPVDLSISADAGVVLVSVENSADDIESAALLRLFDRFFRGNPSRSHLASVGSGLGLSITKAIVEAHGGDIVVHSRFRRVRVVMRFPAQQSA